MPCGRLGRARARRERRDVARSWRFGKPKSLKVSQSRFFSVVVPALELSEHFFWSRGLESILEHDLEGRAG